MIVARRALRSILHALRATLCVLALCAGAGDAAADTPPAQGDPLPGRAVVPPPPDVVASAASGNSIAVPKGESSANTFDYTHLGPKGAALFGRMVARELVAAVPALAGYFKLSDHQ